MSTPLSDLDLSPRTLGALARHGVSTTAEVYTLIAEGTLRDVRWFGDVCERDLARALARYDAVGALPPCLTPDDTSGADGGALADALAVMSGLGAATDQDLALWPVKDLITVVGPDGASAITAMLARRGVQGNRGSMAHIQHTLTRLRRYQRVHGHAAPVLGEVFEGYRLGDRVAQLRHRGRTGQLSSHFRWSLDRLRGWTWFPREHGGAHQRDRARAAAEQADRAALLVTAVQEAVEVTAADVLRGRPEMADVLADLRAARPVMHRESLRRLAAVPGWDWALTHKTTANAWVDWWAQYDLLLMFVHNHRRLPAQTETFRGVPLGRWVRDLRCPGRGLSSVRADLLEQVPGWFWTHGTRPPTPGDPRTRNRA